MVHCCVMGCNSRSERKTENITFHSFPKSSYVRMLWIKSTGRQNWEPGKFTRVCSKHFDDNCFRRTLHMNFLKQFSLPTVDVNFQHTKVQPSTASTKISAIKTCNIKPLINTNSMTSTDKYNNLDQNFIVTSQSSSNIETTLTQREKELIAKLNRQTFLAKSRRKKLAALRSKCHRLEKKNTELSAVIKELQSKHLINLE